MSCKWKKEQKIYLLLTQCCKGNKQRPKECQLNGKKEEKYLSHRMQQREN